MRFEGDLEVLRNLFRKQRLLQKGGQEHEQYRTLILTCSGVMRGVYGGGQGIALDRFGLKDVFDVAVGISTGAPGTGFFLAGQVEKHIDIYWNEAASKEFISFRRFFAPGRPAVDTNYICDVFRKKMDLPSIHASRTHFFVGATCARTGRGDLINAKNATPDIVEAIHASSALPVLCKRVVSVAGVDYVDGVGAMSLPLRQVIHTFAPTDLLVLTNCFNEKKGSAVGEWLSKTLVRNFPKEFRTVYANRNQQFADEVNYLRQQRPCRYGVLWTDSKVGRFERNKRVLREASERARKHFSNLLLKARDSLPKE